MKSDGFLAPLLRATALSASLGAAALAASPDGVTFYAGFEQTVDGVGSAGVTKGDAGTRPPAFQPGLRGAALLAGDGASLVKYAAPGVVTTPEGTVEMWVKSVNWTLPAWGFHVFFRAEGEPGGTMLLYKFGHFVGRLMAYVSDPAIKGSVQSGDPPMRWKPDAWHQFIMTWDKRGVTFFCDGVPCRSGESPRPIGFRVKSFAIGDDAWSDAARGAKDPAWKATADQRNAQTLVDEVYVYNRALTAEEVAWTFKNRATREPGKDVPLDAAPVVERLELTPMPGKGCIGVQVALSPRHRGRATACRVELTKPNELKAAAEFPLRDGDSVAGEIPCPRFPEGPFEVLATMRDEGGRVVGQRSASFTAPAPPVWRGNRIGFSPTPPAPYEPVAVLQDRPGFSCIGRTVTLDDMGLIQRITSQGRDVLSGPMALTLRSGGKPVNWRERSVQLREQDANHAVWQAQAACEIGRLSATITADYDGMVRYDLTLTPDGARVADRLEIELPVRRECTSLNCIPLDPTGAVYETFHEWLAGREKQKSQQPTTSARMDSPWVFYAWLGDEEVGVSGVVESDEAWDKPDRKDAFRLERSPETVKMVWSFCKEPWTLAGPWRLTMGVQPTPVKPQIARDLWRCGKSAESVPGANFWIYWTNAKEMPAFGYPGVKSPRAFEGVVQEYRGRGVGVVPYSLLTQFSVEAPEYPFYFSHLRAPGSKLYGMALDIASFGPGSATARVAPTADYIDFLVWKNHEWVSGSNLAGIYHDLSTVYGFALPEQGLGYRRDGVLRPTYPVFAVRELYRRMYTMTHSLPPQDGRPRLSIIHSPPYAWLVAYCDFNWVGEYAKADYRTSMRPDGEMRMQSGRSVGYRCLWLPQSSATGCSNRVPGGPEQPSRYLAGMVLLHDMNLSPNYMNEKELRNYYTALDRFGELGSARFVPYWKNAAVAVRGEGVFCSAYVRAPEKRSALLCLVNTSDAPRNAEVQVDLTALGAPQCSAASELTTDRPLSFEAGRFKCDLGPYEYRLVQLK